jgi:two-component system, chemotaxis family, protein-glutamate methylesterase/glutaminase
MNSSPIRALLVTDSAPALLGPLQHDADICVVGQVSTARDALAFIISTRPDIVVLDLNLADGSSRRAIEQIMDQAPTPILLLSAATENGHSPSVVEALVAGALDALPTPQHWNTEQGADLRDAVRRLSKAWVIRHLRGGRTGTPTPTVGRGPDQRPVVAMAASTGGPSALASLLAELGGLAAPVLIVQHLHPDFTDGLLEWMSRVSALPVEVARHRQFAEPGHVYLAPGGVHLRLGRRTHLELDPQPVSVHRPSADVLFTSVAKQAGAASVGVVLTGMGEDGAQGLLSIRRQGGRTLAQDEQTCAVFGMPRAAQRIGAVTELLPLSELAAAIHKAVRTLTRTHA